MDLSLNAGSTGTAGHCHRTVRFSREEIAAFARASGDLNRLHCDEAAARRSHHGRIIASGQQTAAQLMGLASSWCGQGADGQVHEVLCLNFNFAFKAPVFADEDLDLQWTLGRVERSERLGGEIRHLDGVACAGDRVCVVARGTVLVRHAVAGDPEAST